MPHVILNEIVWNKNPRVRKAAADLNLTDPQLLTRARTEAEGNAVWSSWLPGVLSPLDSLGVLPKGSANLRVDIDAAIAANFIPTPP